MLIFAVLLSLTSCSKEKRVEYCELGIVLTKDFEPYDSGGAFSVAYSDGNVIVGIARYSYVDCEEMGLATTYMPIKLANVYLEMLNRTVDETVKQYGDVPYFSYTMTAEDGSRYLYTPAQWSHHSKIAVTANAPAIAPGTTPKTEVNIHDNITKNNPKTNELLKKPLKT